MATTTHDEGFHEIQLNGKQLVFLFMAGTVVAVVIFLLGVFVGRGVRAQVPETDPLVASEQNAAPAPEIPPVAASSGSGAPATASEDLSYPERLAGDPPKETLREADAPTAADARTASASARETSGELGRDLAVAASGREGGPSAGVPAEPAGDGFAIQLAALAKRDEAEGIVRRLTSKGYSAYLIAPAAGSPAVYRVRVGKFKDRREAESVSARLQKEEQFKPWIVR
jgi:cell division septation protein DedD